MGRQGALPGGPPRAKGQGLARRRRPPSTVAAALVPPLQLRLCCHRTSTPLQEVPGALGTAADALAGAAHSVADAVRGTAAEAAQAARGRRAESGGEPAVAPGGCLFLVDKGRLDREPVAPAHPVCSGEAGAPSGFGEGSSEHPAERQFVEHGEDVEPEGQFVEHAGESDAEEVAAGGRAEPPARRAGVGESGSSRAGSGCILRFDFGELHLPNGAAHGCCRSGLGSRCLLAAGAAFGDEDEYPDRY